MSDIELMSWERGKVWRVKEEFGVQNRHGKQLIIPKGFRHDRYTFAPDLPDERPAVAHDWAYRTREWRDGWSFTRAEADELLYDLMMASPDAATRGSAAQYYKWVRRLGGLVWAWGSIRRALR